MSNSYDKYLDLKEEGAFEFDSNNVQHVLNKAYEKGWRSTIMLEAMDNIREDSKLTNAEAILKAAKKYHII